MQMYDLDVENMECANPRDIQPMSESPLSLDSFVDQVPSQKIPQHLPNCGTTNNIKMEEYINLNMYLHPISIDELNTPIFDNKNEQIIINNNTNIQDNMLNVMKNPFNFPVKYEEDLEQPNDYTIINYLDNNTSVEESNKISSLLAPDNDILSADIDINMDEYDLLIDYKDALLNEDSTFDLANGCEIVNYETIDISSNTQEEKNKLKLDLVPNYNEIAEESTFVLANGCEIVNYETIDISSHTRDGKNKLKLDLVPNYNEIAGGETIETPDVINAILGFTSWNGNTEVEFEEVTPEVVMGTQEAEEESVSDKVPSVFSWSKLLGQPASIKTPTNDSESNSKRKSSKRKKSNYDSDSDYEPTPKLPSKNKRRKTYSSESSEDSESNYSVSTNTSRRRGRPPKRNDSISSDTSECPTKYREMRDKNNESSRKSRQKRKIKEQVYEEERLGLYETNIKLKTQVAELEKQVNSFRTNIMQLLLK